MIAEIDSETLHHRLTAGEAVRLLDIRSPAELVQGIIPGSDPMPMHLIPLRLSELPREQEVVLYCRSEARSYHACNFQLQQGYTRVVNLCGGIMAWARHGFEIDPPAGRTF